MFDWLYRWLGVPTPAERARRKLWLISVMPGAFVLACAGGQRTRVTVIAFWIRDGKLMHTTDLGGEALALFVDGETIDGKWRLEPVTEGP